MKNTANKRQKTKAVASQPPSTGSVPPSPNELMEMAIHEADRRILDDYTDVIRVLKDDKRFAFREIAKWFQDRGIKTDHMSVYRAYRRTLPPEMAEQLDQETSLKEQNEQKG